MMSIPDCQDPEWREPCELSDETLKSIVWKVKSLQALHWVEVGGQSIEIDLLQGNGQRSMMSSQGQWQAVDWYITATYLGNYLLRKRLVLISTNAHRD